MLVYIHDRSWGCKFVDKGFHKSHKHWFLIKNNDDLTVFPLWLCAVSYRVTCQGFMTRVQDKKRVCIFATTLGIDLIKWRTKTKTPSDCLYRVRSGHQSMHIVFLINHIAVFICGPFVYWWNTGTCSTYELLGNFHYGGFPLIGPRP